MKKKNKKSKKIEIYSEYRRKHIKHINDPDDLILLYKHGRKPKHINDKNLCE